MSDVGKDQKVSSIEEKFATPRIVKNARTGQFYPVGIGLPKDTFVKALNLFHPPVTPHFFQADKFQLIRDGDVKWRDDVIVNRDRVNVLYMHGVFKDGQWRLDNRSFQAKGITIEDIVRDYELSGKTADVLFICSSENNLRFKVVPFQGEYERPKIHMKNRPAEGKVTIDNKTGEVRVQMRVKSEDDVEFRKWKNWGRVKVN